MNDSSYDSLENELNDDPESPYQEQLPLRDKPDSRSRDSVITLSDCDPDPDPDLLLQLPPLARPRRFTPAARQPRTRQSGGVGSQGPRRLRRSSEPALALANTPPSGAAPVRADKHRLPGRKTSYDAAIEGEGEEDEDEVFVEQRLKGLQLKEHVGDGCDKRGAKVQNGGRRKAKHTPPPPLRLDASCSSLSSPATSPTGSSLSSLDSAFSQYSTDCTSNGPTSLYEQAPLSPLFPGRPQPSPRCSPSQKEVPGHVSQLPQPPRAGQAAPHGLHPNTWLKKDRRLSLKQPDNGRPDEDASGNGESADQRRSSSPPSYQQALLQLQHGRSPFYRGSEKPLTVRELRQLHDQTCTYRPPGSASSNNPKPPTGREAGKEPVQPPQGVFYGQSATTLVLQRQKSHSLTPATEGHKDRSLSLPRRASEPARASLSSLTVDRRCKTRPQDVRVSDVEPRFCLSPSATRAVRDYFSSQGQEDAAACVQRSQEVALALVQGKREWQSRRCSDPHMDDFEQLFFAEESYV